MSTSCTEPLRVTVRKKKDKEKHSGIPMTSILVGSAHSRRLPHKAPRPFIPSSGAQTSRRRHETPREQRAAKSRDEEPESAALSTAAGKQHMWYLMRGCTLQRLPTKQGNRFTWGYISTPPTVWGKRRRWSTFKHHQGRGGRVG